jgi:N-methylhydantoinase B
MNVNTVENETGRRVVASIDPISGGAGGNPFEDGTDGSGAVSSFLKNTPVEINEAEVPIKILSYGLATDSGGPGQHRGGLATALEFEVFAPNTRITARNRDRTRFTSWGINGGRGGAPSDYVLNPGGNREQALGNADITTVGPGDVIKVVCGGAGGWGDPLARDPNQVRVDVLRDFVSIERAETDYGVVITDGEVDLDATVALRQSMRERRTAAGEDFSSDPSEASFFDFGAARIEYERVWDSERYTALDEILRGLPVHWRFFVKHRIFERLELNGALQLSAVFGDLMTEYPQLRRAMREN